VFRQRAGKDPRPPSALEGVFIARNISRWPPKYVEPATAECV
jgi:hypothetical protein